MLHSRLTLAVAALAATLLGGSPAWATPMLTNLIVNPGAEVDVGATAFTGSGSIVTPTGWTTTSNFSAVQYATGGASDLNSADGLALGGGNNYFAGGTNNPQSTARQSIDLSDLSISIDAGQITAALSALIGGFDTQGDNMIIEALFLDGSSTQLGAISIGPATVANRSGVSTLLAFSGNAIVPFGTRSVDILMTAQRTAGDYNDGYADNLSFVLRGGQSNPIPLPGTLALGMLGLWAATRRTRA